MWRWRGGNMDIGEGGNPGLEDDLVAQLLLARGVPREDLARHRNPTLRDFLPDPSTFRDMEAAAERLAQAVITGEAVTVYGDTDKSWPPGRKVWNQHAYSITNVIGRV